MRDSFGGVFMMNLFLVFMFIFVAFAAVSLNYAKAFRVKNKVIDFIEENEIKDYNDLINKQDKLEEILNSLEYHKTCENTPSTEFCFNGVTIYQNSITTITENEHTKADMIKYTVIARADWNLGAINKILAVGGKSENSQEYLLGSWNITGEAKVVIKQEK